jgi:tRNA dimethylallyltransferase
LSAKSAAAELPEVVAVVGPTASGKTDFAIVLAERLGGEVISADSVQIYRHFDIGSGKPTEAERRGIPHHLIDAVEPTDEVDASIFAQRATSAIEEVAARGRLPIICGGTFLWVRALLYGLAPAPPKDDAIRERHRAFVENHSRAALHEKLAAVDPQSHARLMPNDFVRVSRALEVFELTGKALSEFQREHGFKQLRYRARLVGVRHAREQLHARIEARVRRMLERGWVAEVEQLLKRGFGQTRPMGSVGYAQVRAALEQSTPIDDERLVQDVAQVTRVFARRQRTWLRDQPVQWLTSDFVGHASVDDFRTLLAEGGVSTRAGVD